MMTLTIQFLGSFLEKPVRSHPTRGSIEVNAKCSLHNSLSITMQSWIQSDNAKVRANVYIYK